MNEQLNNALALLIRKAVETADAASGFLVAEVPDVVKQLITFKISVNAISSISCMLLLVILCVLCKKLYDSYVFVSEKKEVFDGGFFISRTRGYNSDNYKTAFNGLGVLYFIFLFVSIMNFAVLFVISTYKLLYITLAPKVWLLEYASNLIK